MRFSRPMVIGASILAFGVAVAIMLPPTTPIGGARVDPAARPGGLPPVEPIRPTPSVPGPAVQIPSTLAPTAVRTDDEESPPPVSDPAIRQDDPTDQLAMADRDADADPDTAFQRGYRWAERREVQDPRECRLLGDSRLAAGCRSFAHEVAERGRADPSDAPF